MNKENKLLFSKEDATHPQEICSLDLKTKQIQQLTNSAPTAIETSRLSIAEPFKVKSFDNTPIEGSFISQQGMPKNNFLRFWSFMVVHRSRC
jgi:dipeptidyl aminopeptidase/acylaminoacyl peptidase